MNIEENRSNRESTGPVTGPQSILTTGIAIDDLTIELVTHNYVNLSEAVGTVVSNIGEALLSGAFRLEVTNVSPLGYVVELALAPTPADTAGFNPFEADERFVMEGVDIPVAEVGADRRLRRPATVTNTVEIPTEDLDVFRKGRLSLGVRLSVELPRRIPVLDPDYHIQIDPTAVLELLTRAGTDD
jgi:hypothetical protein